MYKVKEEDKLIDFLIKYSNKKRNDIKNLLKYKQVLVNNEIQTYHAYMLKEGDIVDIGKKKETLPFPIIYEDKEFIVINKPSGLVSEQTLNNKTQTAFAIVKEYLKKKKEEIYLVHRLDQETSGVMMFVKNKKLYLELTHHWNDYVEERSYIAIVEGKVNKSGHIENYLSENRNLKVYVAKNNNGKIAITNYHPISYYKGYSMLDVFIETGRKNQIRVHMAHINHPIAGDKKYGSHSNPIKRLALHANIFAFTHPFTKEFKKFEAEIPNSFKKMFKNY